MFPENCFCTLKDIKVGSHEFSRNQKIVTDSFHDLWARKKKLLCMGFEFLWLAVLGGASAWSCRKIN